PIQRTPRSPLFPYTTLFRSGEMVTHIATAGTQQTATSEHVKDRMQQIAVLVNQTATEARNSAHACQGLSELALDLQRMVANFQLDRKSTRLNSSHVAISYAV